MAVAGTFTATGQSDTETFLEGDLSISGTFVATIAVQRLMNGNWVTIEEHTAAVEKVIIHGDYQETRLNCTAYTSGTVNYVLG